MQNPWKQKYIAMKQQLIPMQQTVINRSGNSHKAAYMDSIHLVRADLCTLDIFVYLPRNVLSFSKSQE